MDRPIYVYTYANIGFDDAIALLAGDPELLLQDATDVSSSHGDAVLGHLRHEVAGHEVDREVAIELGDFRPVEVTRSTMPVQWKAARGHVWFPTLDATLEVTSLSSQWPTVQVALVGTYRPPLGLLGAAVDAVGAHGIAEATCHRFVNEVAARLERLAVGVQEADRDVPDGAPVGAS